MDITNNAVLPSQQRKTLGVTMDDTLRMSLHVTTLARTVNVHLRNISLIHQYLSKEAIETIIHSLVSS